MELVLDNALEIVVGILAFCYVLTTLVLGFRLRSYKKLCRFAQGRSVEDYILALEQRTKRQAKAIKQLSSQVQAVKELLQEYPHIWSLSRYNAFKDTGGDLSFSLALLNDGGNGFILSGIHGREESRTYVKPVAAGKSSYTLSDEEQRVLEKALQRV